MANIFNEGDAKESRSTGVGFHLSAHTLTPHFHTRFGPAAERRPAAAAPSRLPPLTNIIRKTSIVGCLALSLGVLLWCMVQTVRSIRQWRRPPGGAEVARAYLLLGSEISLFVVVTLFAFMIPSLIMTWITAVVFDYLFGVRFGRKRHERLISSASNLAREMSWSTLKSAVREGNLLGAAIVTLCLLPWVLGTSPLFLGNAYD